MKLHAVVIGCLLAASVDAATLGSPETFGDGGAPNAGGWGVNDGGLVADAGDFGFGDHAILYSAANDPPSVNGFHFLHVVAGGIPNPDFQGDYTAAGVTAIRFKARHTGDGDSVALRATLFDTFVDGTDWAATLNSQLILNTATTWQTYTMSIEAGDFFTGGPNGRTAAQILAAVVQIGLRHDPLGNGPQTPASVASPTSVLFDDIALITDPFADFDGDGDVDGDDFLTWQGGFGISSGATHALGDADFDGDIDGDDFLTWQSQFGGSSGAATPEPATIFLFLFTGTGCLLLRPRPCRKV